MSTMTPLYLDENVPKESSVLVVEDSPVIALDLQETLFALGFRDVRVAGSVEEAMTILEGCAVSLALMDYYLEGGQTSHAIADHLLGLAVPLIWITGAMGSTVPPAPHPGVPVTLLHKPFSTADLVAAIQRSFSAVE